MQLNTTSYQDILNSLCNELELNEQVILDTIDSGYYMFQQDHQILYEIIDNYLEQSKLYKFEYLVPIEDIYFENYEELTNEEKQYHILAMMMLRLYFYKYDKDFVETDEMNPLMVVANYKSLSSKYLVNKTELDDATLGY